MLHKSITLNFDLLTQKAIPSVAHVWTTCSQLVLFALPVGHLVAAPSPPFARPMPPLPAPVCMLAAASSRLQCLVPPVVVSKRPVP